MAKKPITKAQPRPRVKRPSDPSFMDMARGMSLRDLFEAKLRRENRLDLFRTRLLELESQGVHREAAIAQASGEFGRLSLEKERRLYCQYLAEQSFIARKKQESDVVSVAKQRREEHAYESAMDKLPNTANPAAELDWIRAHPAMTRLDRSILRGKSARIIVDVDDILNCSHGPAPSKSAVNALQHWCNRPDEFFKHLMSEQKKGNIKRGSALSSAMATRADDEPLEDDLSDIDAMLGG
jgi:hypothetical protein